MALPAATLRNIRQWVGTDKPSDYDLEVRYAELGTVEAVALQVLRQRLADMIANPGRFQVDGDASWSYEANMKLLQSDIAKLQTIIAPPVTVEATSEMQVGRIVRVGRER